MALDFSPKGCLSVYKEATADEKVVYFKSRFQFLSGHNGIRPDLFHLFIGMSGAGKTTLSRSLIIDLIENGHSPFIWASEELETQYIPIISEILKEKLDGKFMFFEESQNKEPYKKVFDAIELSIKEKKCDILVFDNLTTSEWYGEGFDGQSAAMDVLKSFSQRLRIPVIIFAHTVSKARANQDYELDQNDVRGSKKITNKSEYIYVMQQFTVKEQIYSTIKVDKHRQAPSLGKYFLFKYSHKDRLYLSDMKIPFDKYQEIFKSRDRLSSRGEGQTSSPKKSNDAQLIKESIIIEKMNTLDKKLDKMSKESVQTKFLH